MQARCLLFEFQRRRDRAEAPAFGRNDFFNGLLSRTSSRRYRDRCSARPDGSQEGMSVASRCTVWELTVSGFAARENVASKNTAARNTASGPVAGESCLRAAPYAGGFVVECSSVEAVFVQPESHRRAVFPSDSRSRFPAR